MSTKSSIVYVGLSPNCNCHIYKDAFDRQDHVYFDITDGDLELRFRISGKLWDAVVEEIKTEGSI